MVATPGLRFACLQTMIEGSRLLALFLKHSSSASWSLHYCLQTHPPSYCQEAGRRNNENEQRKLEEERAETEHAEGLPVGQLRREENGHQGAAA